MDQLCKEDKQLAACFIEIAQGAKVEADHYDPFLDPSYLRKCLLYWDFIDCIFELGRVDEIIPAADFQLLRSEGVLELHLVT